MVASDVGVGASGSSGAFFAWVVFRLVFFCAVSTSTVRVGASFLSVAVFQAFAALCFWVGGKVVVDFTLSVE